MEKRLIFSHDPAGQKAAKRLRTLLNPSTTDRDVNARSAQSTGPWLYAYAAWLLSLVATLGTLFFSEVMKFPPCVLCWYQRIGMYPLVAVLTVGILARDKNCFRYAAPLAFFGLATAIYHNLLYYKLIPADLTPCTAGVSCTERQIEWLGFISIPFLSLLGFVTIGVCLLLFRKASKESV